MKILGQVACPASMTDLYTVPPGNATKIAEIDFCNTSEKSETVSMYYVQSGDSVGVKNTIFKLTLLPGETQLYGSSVFLQAGVIVKIVASTADKVAVMMSGIEMAVNG